MFTFLKMAHGSCEPPILLELAYCGGNPDDKPVILIGKYKVKNCINFNIIKIILSRFHNYLRIDSTQHKTSNHDVIFVILSNFCAKVLNQVQKVMHVIYFFLSGQSIRN